MEVKGLRPWRRLKLPHTPMPNGWPELPLARLSPRDRWWQNLEASKPRGPPSLSPRPRLTVFSPNRCYFPPTERWRNRWVQSTNDSQFGYFRLSSGKFYGHKEKDKG